MQGILSTCESVYPALLYGGNITNAACELRARIKTRSRDIVEAPSTHSNGQPTFYSDSALQPRQRNTLSNWPDQRAPGEGKYSLTAGRKKDIKWPLLPTQNKPRTYWTGSPLIKGNLIRFIISRKQEQKKNPKQPTEQCTTQFNRKWKKHQVPSKNK